MEYLILILLTILILLVLVLLLRPRPEGQSLLLMQQQIDSLREQVRKSLDDASLLIDRRLEHTTKAVSDVQTNLAQLEESNKRIYEVGKDISSLQEILRAPKLRGGLGELLLGDLLSQILPIENFSLPYTFKSGERVDAVIKLGDGLVPVDAKFPLENFRKMIQAESDENKRSFRRQFVSDVKKHIDAIAGKYILPDEGTYDFALMYIPAENIYYETIIKDETSGQEKSISSYSLEKKVIPVSPHTFYIYLRTILLGLKGMRIEERALDVIRNLERLSGDFLKFQEDFYKIGTHLGHAKNCYDYAEKKVQRFGDKLGQIEKPESIEAHQETEDSRS